MKIVNRVSRISFSSYTLVFLVFLTLFAAYFHRISAMTQDLGRHLLTGKIIWTTKQVPTTNLFSYTYPDFPFINTHWFSEVIFFLIQSSFGFTTLLIFTTSLMLGSFAILFFSAKKYASIPAISLTSIILFPVLFERTDLRPELFSFFFLSVYLFILYKYRERFTRLIYVLPFLQILFVNTHIYFFLGIVFVGLFLLESLVLHRNDLKNRKLLVLICIFTLLALGSLLNPNGIFGALYPLHVFNNYGYTIEENQNIFLLQSLFNKPTIPFFQGAVILLFTSFFLTFKKVRLIDWLLAITCTILGAMAVRNFPIFALGVFIPFTFSLSIIEKKIEVILPSQKKSLYSRFFILLLCGLLLFTLYSRTSRYPVSAEVATGSKNAAIFFKKHSLPGPIFNNFDIGSDLEYQLYPEIKTFVDGRPEAYPASFFQEIYIPMQENSEKFQLMNDKYQFNTILFAHTDQTPWGENFISLIVKNPEWKTVYLDPTMIILTKKNVSALPEITDSSPALSPTSEIEKMQLAHFYSIAGWRKSLKSILQSLLITSPKNCMVLYNLAALAQAENDPLMNLYMGQYQTNCRSLTQ